MEKWKIFRFIGKFSDLSENFPQLKIFQFIKFGKKIFRFFQIGKFSTFCKCSNLSDFSGKISTFSIRSENWQTYRPRWLKFRNFQKSWKSGKISDLSENFLYCKYSKSSNFRRKVQFFLNWKIFWGLRLRLRLRWRWRLRWMRRFRFFMRWRWRWRWRLGWSWRSKWRWRLR